MADLASTETQPVAQDALTEDTTQPTEETTEQAPTESGVVYGTMQIPYADFFKAEFEGAKNSDVEVDAVSSATTNKWKGNAVGGIDEATGEWKQGGLVAGTYYEEAETGGRILGVVYPVAVQEKDVDFLKEKYNFTPNEDQSAEPTAYKTVTVDGDNVSFSKINDTDGVQEVGGEVTVQTQTNYGDYQIQIENYPKDADTYGAIIETNDGKYYAMRALENIWRNGQYAWSVGYVTTTHGNNIDNPDYYDTNGATIKKITMITLDGYRTVSDLNKYLPEIFTTGVEVKNGSAGTGAVTADVSQFPADFKAVGNVADGFTVEIANGTANISYQNAQPGNYTLTLSDEGEKYANVKGSFTLSTDAVPAKFDGDGKLVPADGYTQEDVDNFVKNITSVKVGDTSYNTGRRGTTIIKADGTIDKEVKVNNEALFAEGQTYNFVVTSTGYEKPLEFSMSIAPALKAIPVEFDKKSGKLVKADGHTQEEADEFIKNITSVQVGDKTYSAGEDGTAVIKADGTVDTTAKVNNKAIFEAGKDYDVIVNADGYNAPLTFSITIASAGNGNSCSGNSSSSRSSSTKSGSTSTTSSTAAPKTGQSSGAAPFVALASILGLAGIVSKKNKQ